MRAGPAASLGPIPPDRGLRHHRQRRRLATALSASPDEHEVLPEEFLRPLVPGGVVRDRCQVQPGRRRPDAVADLDREAEQLFVQRLRGERSRRATARPAPARATVRSRSVAPPSSVARSAASSAASTATTWSPCNEAIVARPESSRLRRSSSAGSTPRARSSHERASASRPRMIQYIGSAATIERTRAPSFSSNPNARALQRFPISTSRAATWISSGSPPRSADSADAARSRYQAACFARSCCELSVPLRRARWRTRGSIRASRTEVRRSSSRRWTSALSRSACSVSAFPSATSSMTGRVAPPANTLRRRNSSRSSSERRSWLHTDRVPERALATIGVAVSGRDVEPGRESIEQLLDREQTEPCSRELQREREPVEAIDQGRQRGGGSQR